MELELILEQGFALCTRFASSFANENEVHSLYQKSVEIVEEIKVHYSYGTSPSKLIDSNRPNESQFAKNYRINSYEQSTFSFAKKIVGLQKGAIFHPDLYSLEFSQNIPILAADDTLENYIKKEIPNTGGMSLEQYVVEFVHQIAMIDPNGFIAILPKTPDYRIESPGEMRRPYPTYIPSSHVLDFSEEYVFVRSSEQVEIRDSMLVGEVFVIFTPDATIKYVEVDTSGQETRFEAFIVESHEGGSIRARQIGGVATLLEDKVLVDDQQKYFLSHIQSTIPFFNLALRNQSEFQASVTAHLFPRLYEAFSDCPRCNGSGTLDESDPDSVCPSCQGQGKVTTANSPLVSYTVEPNEQGVVNPPAGYISPNIAVISEARQIRDGYIRDALRSVNMELLIEQQTAQQQTAESKRIDREALHNHFRQVARTMFDLYQWMLDQINELRYGPILSEDDLEANRVTILEPRTYITTLPFEALELVKQANEAEAHHATKVKLQEETIGRLFGESIRGKLALISLRLDPLPLRTPDEILAMSSVVSIPEDTIGLHFSISEMVNLAYERDATFVAMSIDEQKRVVVALYNETKTPELV